MKKVLLIISLLFFINVKADTYEVILSNCVDGDTAFFSMDGSDVQKYRFIAVDAPEVVDNDDNLGMTSSKFVCNMLKNAKTILIEEDDKAKEDKYGRKLAWVWADKKLVQKEIIENGYAKVAYVYDDYKYSNSLCKIQNEAIKDKKGIWQYNNEIGYCQNIDTSNIEDNIKYQSINSDNIISSKDKKTYTTLKKVDELLDKATNYTQKNDDKFVTYLFYGIIGVAILFIIFKYFKEK